MQMYVARPAIGPCSRALHPRNSDGSPLEKGKDWLLLDTYSHLSLTLAVICQLLFFLYLCKHVFKKIVNISYFTQHTTKKTLFMPAHSGALPSLPQEK